MPSPRTVAISPAIDDVAPRRAGGGEDPDRGRLRLLAPADADSLARPERAGEQADVGDALARRRPLDLEDAAGDGRVGVTPGAGRGARRCRRAARRSPTPRAAEPKNTGWTRPRRVWTAELLAEPLSAAARLVADVGAQDRLVVLGEDLRRPPGGPRRRRERHDRRRPTAGVADRLHRDDRGREPPRHRRDDALGVGAGPVDLVDEDQGRDAKPLERAEQERRLRLDALDRGDDEHRAVEDAEDAFDLGDEVGMAGRVDEVDREVADQERGDRRPDRDAAFAFELERVGLGGAGVDAADVVDGAGGEEESFGESGLTGVDVGEDSEIERAHGTSCRARR